MMPDSEADGEGTPRNLRFRGDPGDLLAYIRALIAREGPLTFRRFMALALYHPQYGYYLTPGAKMGREGDYLTSPGVHPIFGYAVARQLLEMWEVLGRPRPFLVVEAGAGTGALARAILAWARRRAPDLYAALDYRLLEASPYLKAQERQLLAAYKGKVAWGTPRNLRFRGDPAGPRSLPRGVVGCFLQNELFDSFPVHRVVAVPPDTAGRAPGLREVYVGWRQGRLQELLGAPSTPRLAAYFRRLGLWPGEGCGAEVNLAALDFMARIARGLERGFVLSFDYGYEAAQLFAPWRREGTLMAFYRHNPSHDPYARPGRQDLTSHVDFTSLIEVGRRWGLEPLGLTTQARFLAALGIQGELSQEVAELEEHYTRRRALLELLDPAGLGRIRVLVQAKGVGRVSLQGLREAEG